MKRYKPLKKITDYNYTNEYNFIPGKYDTPVRIRKDLTSSNRDDILLYLKDIGLVDKYSLKLFKSVYSYLSLKYPDLYQCYEFQEFLGNIWLIIAEVPQEKWTEIWNNNGRTGITAYVSGIIHRTIVSTASNSYKQVFRHAKENINFDDEGWRKLQDDKSPEELDPFNVGTW